MNACFVCGNDMSVTGKHERNINAFGSALHIEVCPNCLSNLETKINMALILNGQKKRTPGELILKIVESIFSDRVIL